MTSTATALSTLFLYLDIETIPSQDPAVRAEIDAKHTVPALDLESIQPAANLKDPEKVAADLEKRRAKAVEDHAAAFAKAAAAAEEEYRKTALDGTTGHIACASVALNDDEIINVQNGALGLFTKPTVVVAATPDAIGQRVTIRPGFKMVLDDERKMLEALFAVIENTIDELVIDLLMSEWDELYLQRAARMDMTERAIEKAAYLEAKRTGFIARTIPTLVAHHSQFDVRFIWQRAIILGVKVPAWWPHDARPWDTDRLQDTMTGWAGHGNRIGLDRLCRALGIEGRGDIEGSKVWDAVQAGRINNVCQYCDDDVARLRAVHRRIAGISVETTTVETWSNRNGRAEIVATHVEGGA
jgi:3'-5' exonuclease